MSSFLQDLRHGVRLLIRQPGFTLIAVLVLALGIGANTTIFSLVDVLAMKPRAGGTEELVSVYSRDREEPDSYRAFSYPNFADLRARRDVFDALTAHVPSMIGITEGDTTRRAFIDIVTADYFSAFGVPLALGRTFTAEEERPAADLPVTILSYPAWQRMGGAPDVLTRTIRINQRDFSIVGVAPEGFGGTMAMVIPEVFLPTGVYDTISNDFVRDGRLTSLADRSHHNLFLVGRLRDGLTIASAAPALESVSRAMEEANPAENRRQALSVDPVSRLSISTSPQGDGPISVMATVLLSMSGIVLLVASLNLANMQLARGGARRKEFAIRLAIGGSRLRLVRQLLTEGLLLSLAGGAVALGLSTVLMRLLSTSMAGRLPIQIALDATPDWRVFAATLVFAVAATVLFGLGPGLALARTQALPELKEASGEMPVRRSRLAVRHVLVMGQLALSLALLTAGGLFVRGAQMAASLDPGFTFDRGIVAQVDASLAGYDRARAATLYERTVDRLKQLPGVTSVGFSSLMPFGEITESRSVQIPGPRIRPSDPNAASGLVSAVASSVSPDYFNSLGLALVRGRDFTTAETFGVAGRVAIIDQALARRLFGDADPIGRQLQFNPRDDASAPDVAEIVGIAPAILHQMTDAAPGPQVYVPLAQDFRMGLTVHLRTAAPSADAEAAMLPVVRQALRELDDRLPVVALETRPMFRDRNLMLWVVRAGAWVFTGFGLVALFMAALGIYGVKAYLVSRRTREIGIRMALGANARDVIRLVLADGMVLTMTGLLIGLALSVLVSQGVGSLLFQGAGFDPAVVAAAFATLLCAAALASWLPARRATRIAPTRALRE